MVKHVFVASLALLAIVSSKALASGDSTANNLHITGYVQNQFQFAQTKGQNAAFAGGNFKPDADNRFAIRRGRVKFTYEKNNQKGVMQLDATENGVRILEAYFKATEKYTKAFSLTVGLFNRPFGHEIAYSSSLRESPERSRMIQTLLPSERDLGAMISFQHPKLKQLTIDAAIVNGTGISITDFDRHKDFIGHITYKSKTKNELIEYGIGASAYMGKFLDTTAMNTLQNGAYVTDGTKNNYAKRDYYGVDAQLAFTTPLGKTTLRAEFIEGVQTALKGSSTSLNALTNESCYQRNFAGYYGFFIQNLGKSKHQLVAKYDVYDPNTKLSAATDLTVGDIRYSTLGLGYICPFSDQLKMMAYYDIVKNETTAIKGYTSDLKDNILTIRMQYKF